MGNSGALKRVRSGLYLHSVFVMIVGNLIFALQPRARGVVWWAERVDGWGEESLVWVGSNVACEAGKASRGPENATAAFCFVTIAGGGEQWGSSHWLLLLFLWAGCPMVAALAGAAKAG